MQTISKNIKETAQMAYDFGSSLKPKENQATIVGLYGELGAGKTTFMKYLAEYFEVADTIQSPTFVIMKKYNLKNTNNFDQLIHIDAYRIENSKEMLVLGWQEMLTNSKSLICVEWPERIAEIMGEHIVIRFEHVKDSKGIEGSENQRKISIT
jgi:tRNA threonylcarbamoyladenosine biosynthesis protein TsaE